jgi:riboflavin synthase
LTVNEVSDAPAENGGVCRFGINIVPHTAAVTTFGGLEVGSAVNLEIDLVARYLQRLMQKRA